MLRTILLGMSALALIGCSAVASPTITGRLTMTGGAGSKLDKTATTCAASGGYDDIHDGAQVVVKDGAGVIIGTGLLALDPEADKRGNVCVWTFKVPVKTSDFYSLNIGHRDPLTYSHDEMESEAWNVGLTLGD
jgi:hypothetical protein